MEIHQPAIGPPAAGEPGHLVVPSSFGKAEAAAQVVAGADVVAWQHLVAGEAAQQDVLGAPAADAGQGEQDLPGAVIVSGAERLQVQCPGCLPRRDAGDGAGLRPAESQSPQLSRVRGG